MTDHKEQPLSATTFEPATTQPESVAAASGGESSRAIIIGLAVAAVLLIFVFFVLPQLVTPDDDVAMPSPEQSTATASGTASLPAGTASEAGNGRSPFAEAQESALRREAQEALQSLLTLQESLAERGAPNWGEPDYSQALEAAAAGDTAYRERDFAAAGANESAAVDGRRTHPAVESFLVLLSAAAVVGALFASHGVRDQSVGACGTGQLRTRRR